MVKAIMYSCLIACYVGQLLKLLVIKYFGRKISLGITIGDTSYLYA